MRQQRAADDISGLTVRRSIGKKWSRVWRDGQPCGVRGAQPPSAVVRRAPAPDTNAVRLTDQLHRSARRCEPRGRGSLRPRRARSPFQLPPLMSSTSCCTQPEFLACGLSHRMNHSKAEGGRKNLEVALGNFILHPFPAADCARAVRVRCESREPSPSPGASGRRKSMRPALCSLDSRIPKSELNRQRWSPQASSRV